MKRIGSVVLVLAGFIAGLAFVYSCGTTGNDAEAQPRSPLDIHSYQVELTPPSSSTDLDVPLGSNEYFIVTDVTVGCISVADVLLLKKSPNSEDRFRFMKGPAGSGTPVTESIHFHSGIVFNPGETMRVEGTNLGNITSVNISGYFATG